jgi:hypothetical protein
MTIEELNLELQCLADEERQAMVDIEYDAFMDEMYRLWELEQYAADSYDLDAEFYGAW